MSWFLRLRLLFSLLLLRRQAGGGGGELLACLVLGSGDGDGDGDGASCRGRHIEAVMYPLEISAFICLILALLVVLMSFWRSFFPPSHQGAQQIEPGALD